ncbi:hypothetical protein L1283_005767 [Sphingobacterium sp. HSC-15S19]
MIAYLIMIEKKKFFDVSIDLKVLKYLLNL